MDDPRIAIRNAAVVVAHRGLQAAGGLLFVALIPRIMGPELYGRYALVTSMALWFALASGLGLVTTTTQYLPQLLGRDEIGQIRRLVGNLLTLRVVGSGIAALVYLTLLAWWWPDLDRIVLGVMAGSVFVQGIAGFLFALFLGFNKAGRSAVGEAVRRWVLLALVVPGFQLDGLRGVVFAVLLTDVIVLALGFWWTRPRPSWADLWPDRAFLAPFVRFGLAFLATQWLNIAFQGSGEPLVRASTGSYTQVGYFGLAQTTYLVAAGTLGQLMLAFAPTLSHLRSRGRTAELAQWSARLLKCLAAGGVLVVFGAWFLAELVVPVVFGGAYHPVVPNLVALSLAVLAGAIGAVSGALALAHERPGVPLGAAAIRLALFWSVGPLLVDRWASLGGCIAVVAASTVHAGYLAWRMRDVGGGQVRAWLVPVAIGALFLPLAWLRSASPWDAALFLAFVVGYPAALLRFRVVTRHELAAFVRVFLGRGGPAQESARPVP